MFGNEAQGKAITVFFGLFLLKPQITGGVKCSNKME
jgi:hypothetical protein